MYPLTGTPIIKHGGADYRSGITVLCKEDVALRRDFSVLCVSDEPDDSSESSDMKRRGEATR